MQCEGITPRGQPCKAPALNDGGQRCWFHSSDETIVATRKAAPALRSRSYTELRGPDATRISRLLYQVLNDVRDGKLSAERGRSIAAVASVWSALNTKALQESQFAERLAALEAALNAQQSRRLA